MSILTFNFDGTSTPVEGEFFTNSFYNTTSTGDIKYQIQGYETFAVISNEEFQTGTDFTTIEDLSMNVQVTQDNPKEIWKCNFEFNINFNINIKFPDLNAPPPNFTLLDKINNFSNEISSINNILINSIQQMNCCQVADGYNHTLVRLFRWLADSSDIQNCTIDGVDETNDCGPIFGGETFTEFLLKLGEIILKIYLVIRPLACLVRPLPGNPWFPWDFDPLSWVGFILDTFDLLNDIFVSGKLFDKFILSPTKNLRKNIEKCLFCGGKYTSLFDTNAYKQSLILNNIAKTTDLYKSKIKSLNTKKEVQLNKLNDIISKQVDMYYIEDNQKKYIIDSEPFDVFVIEQVNYLYNSIPDEDKDKTTAPKTKSEIYQKFKDYSSDIYNNLLIKYNINNTSDYYINLYEPDEKLLSEPLGLEEPFFALLFDNDISNAIVYQKQIEDINSQVKIYENYINKLHSAVKVILSTYGSTEMVSLSQYQLNELAKGSAVTNSSNICECFFYSILDLYIPVPISFNSLYYKNLEPLEDKTAFFIKTKVNDFLGSVPTDDQSYPAYFKKETLQRIDEEFKYLVNMNSSFVDYTYPNFTIVRNPTSNLTTTITEFIELIEDKEKYYKKFEINNKEISFYNPYKDGEVAGSILKDDIVMPVFDVDILYTSMKKSDYIKNYLIPALKIKNDLINTSSNITAGLDKFREEDLRNFNAFKLAANTVINTMKNDFITNKNTRTPFQNEAITEYIEKQVELYNNFFNSYKSINLIDDPYDLSVKSYYHTKISTSELDLYGVDDLGTSYSVSDYIDNYIELRAQLFEAHKKDIISYFYIKQLPSEIDEYTSQEIDFITVQDQPDIPCGCDFFCKIIQYIINFLLSLIAKLVQQFVNYLMELFWNSPIGKLIKLIIAKIKCIMMIVNMQDDFNKLNEKTEALLNAIKGRIKLYVDTSACSMNLDTGNDVSLYNNYDFEIQEFIKENPYPDIDLNYENSAPVSDTPTQTVSVQIDNNGDLSTINLNGDAQLETIGGVQNLNGTTISANIIISDGVNIVSQVPNEFPLLNFDCVNCNVEEDPLSENCTSCPSVKLNDTMNFLNT